MKIVLEVLKVFENESTDTIRSTLVGLAIKDRSKSGFPFSTFQISSSRTYRQHLNGMQQRGQENAVCRVPPPASQSRGQKGRLGAERQ